MKVAVPMPRTAIRRGRPRSGRWGDWISPVALLILWEIASQANWIDRRVVPPPTTVVATLATMFAHEGLLTHLGYTLGRFLGGLLLGVIPGTLLGLTMGLFLWPRKILQPLVSIFYPLPHIALFPIVLILVGMNERSNLLMIALGPFFTMMITTANAVRTIDRIYFDVAKSYEVDLRDLYLRVVLPAALPVMAGGFRVAIGMALVATIAVEFLVADTGIGHVIWNSWQILSLKRSMAGLVVTGLIGFASFLLFAWIERRAIPWQHHRS